MSVRCGLVTRCGTAARRYMMENNDFLGRHRGRYFSNASLDERVGRGKYRASRHPPHLKGKEIGLYYARLNKERKAKEQPHAAEKSKDGSTSGVHTHRQKDYQLPEIVHSEDIEKTLHELANTVIPDILRTSMISRNIPNQPLVDNVCEVGPSSLGQNQEINRISHDPNSYRGASDQVCDTKLSSSASKKYTGQVRHYSLVRNEETDRNLCRDLRCRSTTAPLQVFRTKLPAYDKQQDILNAVQENQVILIMGETGCGKTTQVPQFILDSFISAGRGSLCKVVCTQPRRISAITVAERVACERSVPCGQKSEVGYQIRLECEMPADQGSILFCTTGIVLQWLQENPLLNGITHIVVDEVHERDILCDFLLIILKDILKIRSDLKVILMSATLDRENLSNYFDGCPIIMIPGYTFPVEVVMLEDIIETTGYDPDDCHSKKKRTKISKQLREQKALEYDDKSAYLQSLEDNYSARTINILESWDEEDIDLNLVTCLIKHICCHEKEGAILVFLPGWEQIKALKTLIMNDGRISSCSLIVPLHSLMPTISQREAFEKPRAGIRKIVLATNIAETSITIDDVVFVIDCGKIKMHNFDHSHDIATLKPEWVAKSNAKQRKGRAGRTQSGTCYRLFTKFREDRLDEYQLPEMLRVRLEEIILKVKLLKLGFAQEFLRKALDPPSEVMIVKSVDLLKKLGALDELESLTPLGYQLAQLPMAPQLSKMCILGAVFSCLDPVLSIAASLSFREPFVIPMGQEKQVDNMKQTIAGTTCSDHVLLHRMIEEFEIAERKGYGPRYCYDHFLSPSTVRMLVNLKAQFAEHLCRLQFIDSSNPKDPVYNQNSSNLSVLKAVIAGGLYPNIAALFGKIKPRKYIPPKVMDGSSGTVQFHPKSVNSNLSNCKNKLLVYFLKVKSSQNFLHDSTILNVFPAILFGHDVQVCDHYGFQTVCVDSWLHLKCSVNNAVLIKDVSEKLDSYLLWKFSSTNKYNVNRSLAWEKDFIDGIVRLINQENNVNLCTW